MSTVVAAVGFVADTSRFDQFVAQLDDVLAAPTAQGSPLRAGVEEAANLYAVEMQNRFSRASGGDGTWPALAESTVRQKSRRTLFPRQLLYDTGALFASLTPGASNSIYDVLEDRVRYGTRDPKARFHQSGTPRMPARPILAAPTPDQLARCTAPIVSAWRDTIHALCFVA